MTAMDINKVKNETENFIQLHIKFSNNRSFFFPIYWVTTSASKKWLPEIDEVPEIRCLDRFPCSSDNQNVSHSNRHNSIWNIDISPKFRSSKYITMELLFILPVALN